MKNDEYATKEEVREIVDTMAQRIITVLLDELKKELASVKADLAGVKEDIIQFKDDILHEIIDLRDDVTVTTGYRDRIEDHEERITDLEKKKTN